jgi:hypothetical protein
LRANGSRECAPDDRLREAIHSQEEGLDCFVAALLAMTAGTGHLHGGLREVLAKDCRMESVSSNVGRQYGQQQPEGYTVNGSVNFQITLK